MHNDFIERCKVTRAEAKFCAVVKAGFTVTHTNENSQSIKEHVLQRIKYAMEKNIYIGEEYPDLILLQYLGSNSKLIPFSPVKEQPLQIVSHVQDSKSSTSVRLNLLPTFIVAGLLSCLALTLIYTGIRNFSRKLGKKKRDIKMMANIQPPTRKVKYILIFNAVLEPNLIMRIVSKRISMASFFNDHIHRMIIKAILLYL